MAGKAGAQNVTISASGPAVEAPVPISGSFVISRTGPVSSPLSVSFSVESTTGSALPGIDYTLSGVSFSGNTATAIIPADSSKLTLLLTPIDDAVYEGSESVRFTLIDLPDYDIGVPAGSETATLSIADLDPAPGVSFTRDSQSSTAESGSLRITARLSAVAGVNVSLPFTVTGSASAGVDYTISSSPLMIPAGVDSAVITITIIDDAIDETNENVRVTMGTPINATTSGTTSHNAIITDDDVPLVSFSMAAQQSGVESGNLQVTADLSISAAFNVVVPLLISGTASNNSDYVLSQTQIVIPVGFRSGSINVTIVDDQRDEPDETLILTMGTPTAADKGAITVHTISIEDDDEPELDFLQSSITSADESGSIQIPLRLSMAPAAAVSVPYILSGSATPGVDYQITPVSPMSIQAQETNAQFVITILNDNVDESNEDIVITLDTPANASLGSRTVFTLTITDDDGAGITISPLVGLTTTEAGGTASFMVRLNSQPLSNVQLDLRSSNINEGSIHPQNLRTLTFSPLNWSVPQTVLVTGVNDNRPDGDRPYNIITAPTRSQDPAYHQLDPYDVSLQNKDDDLLRIKAGQRPVEGNRSGSFIIELDAPAPPGGLDVYFTLAGSTAGPSDYNLYGSTSGNIVLSFSGDGFWIAPGVTKDSIMAEAPDDNKADPNETLVMRLLADSAYSLDTNRSLAQLIIEDDEVLVDCATTYRFCDNGGCNGDYNKGIENTTFEAGIIGKSLKAVFKSFALAGTDELTVYDGDSDQSPVLGVFTGNTLPDTLISAGASLTFVFASMPGIGPVAAGFEIELSCTDIPRLINCNTSQSFCYPLDCGDYQNNEDAVLTYRAEGDKKLQMVFNQIDINNSDYFEVYDGPSIKSPPLGRFTGTTTPSPLISSGRFLTFVFHSNDKNTGSGVRATISCSDGIPDNQADRKALMELYLHTGGTGWKSFWDISKPMYQWKGVLVNPVTGRVVRLELPGNNLKGDLPIGFFEDPNPDPATRDDRLSKLEVLSLGNNEITGILPVEIHNLLNLRSLDLSRNQLDSLPWGSLSLLDGLETLNASNNHLKDTIPSDINDLTSLKILDLSYNSITGEVPYISDLKDLLILDLSHNKFNGEIPLELGDLPVLEELSLNNNDLEGSIPASLQWLAYLSVLDLSDNNLSGKIPPTLGNLFYLEYLNLSNNRLSGNIPEELGYAEALLSLNLGNNKLSGSIPASLGMLEDLQELQLYRNELSGAIPEELGDLEWLTVLDLRDNKLGGAVPASFQGLDELQELSLYGNQLTGLPDLSELSSKKQGSLKRVYVYNNELTFEDLEPNADVFNDFIYAPQAPINNELEITAEKGSAVSLNAFAGGSSNLYQWKKGNIVISAQNTSGYYTIPEVKESDVGVYTAEVTNKLLPDLTLIRRNILLTVVLPGVNLDDSLALVALFDSANGPQWEKSWNLQKPVRDWYGVWVSGRRVVKVLLNDNKLSGKLPSQLGALNALEELNLRNNRLGDDIPASISALTLLSKLDLSNNQLIGPIPPGISKLEKLSSLDLQNNRLSGNIPPQIGSMLNLKQVNLYLNDLSGAIPPELGQLRNLLSLSLNNNNLMDSIPRELCQIPGLQYLYLNNNFLSGRLPDDINKLSQLKELDLSNNRLSDLPVINPGKLEKLLVNNNALTFEDLEPNIKIKASFVYSPQAEIGQDEEIKVDWGTEVKMSVKTGGSANDYLWRKNAEVVRGRSPDNSYVIAKADYSDAALYRALVINSLVPGLVLTSRPITLKVVEPNSSISDSLALVALFNSTQGSKWERSWDLSKSMKEWFGVRLSNGRVVSLILNNNRLLGTLPAALGNLGALRELSLRSNEISGSIPSSLSRLSQLKELNLRSNQLQGLIPEQLGELSMLENLYLDNNRLSGAVPQQINRLRELEELLLDGNRLTALPPLSSLPKLERLLVQSNLLTFESLEPNIAIAGFVYSPQQQRDTIVKILNPGENILLNADIGGSANRYRWSIVGQNNSLGSEARFVKNAANLDDMGLYRVEVSNSIANKLVITVFFNVKVIPEKPIVKVPLPYCIGDTVITLTAEGNGRESTVWYSDQALSKLIGRGTSIRFRLPSDASQTTVYAVTEKGGIRSTGTTEILLLIRPTIERNGQLLTASSGGNAYQWFVNDYPIKDATQQRLSINGDGEYKVTLFTKDGCAATSLPFRVGVVGWEDELLARSLSLYPNPTASYFTLNISSNYRGNVALSLSNALGQTLQQHSWHKSADTASYQLDLSALPAGVYWLHIKTPHGQAVKRVLKE